LDRAFEEAARLGHKYVGTEHPVAGVLLEQDCYPGRFLHEHGVSLETVRSSMKNEPTKELAPGKAQCIPAGYHWKKLLYNPASKGVVIEMTPQTLDTYPYVARSRAPKMRNSTNKLVIPPMMCPAGLRSPRKTTDRQFSML
jgi:hypothetical protein